MNLPYTIASQDLADPDELRLNRLLQLLASQIISSNVGLSVSFSGASNGTQGVAYSAALVAAGGVPPYSFVALGSLPAGLSVNLTSGVIMGTPSSTGTFNFVGQVTDSAGTQATVNCTIVISASGSTIVVTYTTTLAASSTLISVPAPTGMQSILYVQITQSSGGGDQITWDTMFVPAPPVNLNLDANAQSVFSFAKIVANQWRITGIWLG